MNPSGSHDGIHPVDRDDHIFTETLVSAVERLGQLASNKTSRATAARVIFCINARRPEYSLE